MRAAAAGRAAARQRSREKVQASSGSSFGTGMRSSVPESSSTDHNRHDRRTPTDAAASCLLDDYGTLRFSGADAGKFLQGQLSNDLERLQPAAMLRAGLHNPQGRTLALLWLASRSRAATSWRCCRASCRRGRRRSCGATCCAPDSRSPTRARSITVLRPLAAAAIAGAPHRLVAARTPRAPSRCCSRPTSRSAEPRAMTREQWRGAGHRRRSCRRSIARPRASSWRRC